MALPFTFSKADLLRHETQSPVADEKGVYLSK